MSKMKKLRVLSLCDGISTGLYVLKKLGFEVEYHAIEIEDYKRKIADANHEGIIRPSNDVIEYADQMEFDHFDFVFCGFTCTSLSSQGAREGWNGESKIFFDCLAILKGCQKTNPKLNFLFENVASMKNSIREEITEKLGAAHFLGSSGLVSNQDRNRYYWFNWDKPVIEQMTLDPRDDLDEDGLALFSFSKSNRNKAGEKAIVEGRFKANGKAGTLVTGKGCKGQSTITQVVTKQLKVRDLTTSECARLQGIGDYKWPCSESQIFEAIGEGWEANMVSSILKTAPILKKVK